MKSRKRKQRFRRTTSYDTMEVSIVGSGYDKFKVPALYPITPGKFIYVKMNGEEHEKLVKFRSWSNSVTKKNAISIRPAPLEKVVSLMKNMARGFLWEEGIDVKIVDATLQIDPGHIEFLFVATEKMDLRKYCPPLAKLLHLKVKFTQIGARDMAMLMGGIGRCGRELCCTTFLKDLPSVTLEMARKQYLFSAPEKLSGVCGRLLCCLRFELPYYEEVSQFLPNLGDTMETEKGLGKVIEVNAIKLFYRLNYETGEEQVIWVNKSSECLTKTEDRNE